MPVKAHFKDGKLVIEVTDITQDRVKKAELSKSGGSRMVAYQQFTDIEGVPEALGKLKFSFTVISPLPKAERPKA
jgi:hypothetical protein